MTAAPATPDTVRTVADLRRRVAAWRAAGESVGLVPTMGALHAGHLALVRAALDGGDRTVVSIFVNPTQFGPGEDFDTYPRRLAADRAALAALGVDLIFAPENSEIYPAGFSTSVTVSGLAERLCGAARPHHFAGVTTVVSKLLLAALPDRAYFGEKDYQQLQIVRRLVRDLAIPVAIEGVATVREADGLALSSRNANLTAEQRRAAPELHRVLRAVADAVAADRKVATTIKRGLDDLTASGFTKIDYLEVVDAETLERLVRPGQPARVLAAAWLGETRLIDNVPVPAG